MAEGNNVRNTTLFAMLASGFTTLVVFAISLIFEVILRDPIISEALIKIIIYIVFISILFVLVPLITGVHTKPISKAREIAKLALLTYILSSASVAVFLSLTTEMIDYDSLAEENIYTKKLIERGSSCTFDLKESFFDTVSGFTTTGLTAFRKTGTFIDGKEISKIDAQPMLIHVVRASYLWIGGLGIIFFYLFFTPISSLAMSVGYEIPARKSHPLSIRKEGLYILWIYILATIVGVSLLSHSISSAQPWADNETVLSYSVVLTFSSISTGGFSPGSAPLDEIPYPLINNWSLLVIMGLMFAGAMPIFSLHRTSKFFRWRIFAVFLFPIFVVAAVSYFEDGSQVSLHRSFDALSAFTTTGLYTSQFVEDSEIRWISEDKGYGEEPEKEMIRESYRYRFRCIYLIMLMFIGGAAYSTAGGFGFSNAIHFIRQTVYLFYGTRKRIRRVLMDYFNEMSVFLLFLLVFATGTLLCYISGLFGIFSSEGSTTITYRLINSAFYEISALSTVGLMPDSMLLNDGIYYHNLVYWTLIVSMLIGRLYRILYLIPLFLRSPKEVT
ncbi:MAG: hypothetical protein AYK18_07950 [Theionarchaea archaeon DG-70]|nr:MAG: hypothetical protein AYK18_07950 [Theionarchaea archaeon DG-70]MBU7026953.1 TrkH family potassium uptake protein [Theionarchaea archaeon]